jgi:hypothetical protein
MSDDRTNAGTSARLHFTADNYEKDGEHFATCRCGQGFGPLLDIESLLDEAMAHAYWAGREDADSVSSDV